MLILIIIIVVIIISYICRTLSTYEDIISKLFIILRKRIVAYT